MMKRILLAFSTFAFVSIALAQSAEERTGFASRGSQNKEQLASAAKPQQPASLVSEIYPNPTSDQGTITLNLNAPGKVTFYNLLGTPVHSQEFGKEAKTVAINFSNFSEGVYFGIVTSGNKTVATRRISVKR